MAADKEIPWCTIFLVLGAFVSNVLVLIGNLDAAASFGNVGQSTGGWSGVGKAMAHSFDNELTVLMNEVTLSLSHAVQDISNVNSEVDSMLATIGKKTDTALLQVAKRTAEVAVQVHHNRTINAQAKQFPGVSGLPSLPDVPIPNPYDVVKMEAMAEVSAEIHHEVGEANKLLRMFLTAITPALIQIGKWEISFGTKLQADITQFGTTIDWVQKSFDTMMAKLKGGDDTLEDFMLFNTFNLFDPEANDCITEDGLIGAAAMYGITALQGVKGEAVFKEYANKDGCIDHDGYRAMASNPGLAGILTTVLRTYSEGLSRVAGTISQARLRSAVASSVVSYFDLVSAKNHTKVGWIAERLTNGSIPQAFTAVTLMELGFQSFDPNVMSTIDVGQLVVDFLIWQNMTYTLECFEMMSSPSFWTTEGFLTTQLADVVKVVGGWIHHGINVTKMGTNPGNPQLAEEEADANKYLKKDDNASLLQTSAQAGALAKADALFKSGYVDRLISNATAAIKKQKYQDHLALVERREALDSSHTSKHLFNELLGGKTMSRGTMTPTEWQVLHQGVPAVPATLEFAKFLAWNCTLDSSIFLHYCFKYSSTSSNQLDAFANEIKGFVGKTQSFLTTIMAYSGKKGIEFLEDEITNFVKGAEAALISAIEPKVDSIVDAVIDKYEKSGMPLNPENIMGDIEGELGSILGGGAASAASSMPMLGQLSRRTASAPAPSAAGAVAGAEGAVASAEGDASKVENDMEGVTMVVFEDIRTLLGDLMALLPSAVTTVNDARAEIAKVAQMMASIFDTFGVMGPEIFNDISLAYSALWTVYFILLLPLTVGTLFYGMWASGYFGGPAAADWPEESEEQAARPKSFMERCGTCYNACCICCGKCHDSMIAFWSCMIIYQIIVLVIFIVGIVLCMLNGVKVFFSASCLEVYLLSQDDMCTAVLNSVKGFIETFSVDPLLSIEETCSAKNLLMCELIGQKMQTSMLYTTIFSFTSAIFQYQLVIESAILHERARMRRIVQELEKRRS